MIMKTTHLLKTALCLIAFSTFNMLSKAEPYVIPSHNYQFNVPKDASVYVGDKDQAVGVAGNYLSKHYVPFTKIDEVYILETDTSHIWYYDLPAPKNAAGGFNYRISRDGSATHVGLFKPKAGTEVQKDTLLVFTDKQLSAYSSKAIDHDEAHLDGRNVADVFININAQGFLSLPLRPDTSFQLIHTRNWQAIDSDINNYFIEPDFHYSVVDENGQPSSSVINISETGEITPVGAGTAIVLVDYDAMLSHHTTNFRLSADSLASHGALFSKLWPENTGVFVVAVDQPEANINSNMNLNAFWAQDGTDKTDGVAIDAEHDVMYFEASQGSFPYTFSPEGVTRVLVATPGIGELMSSYSGFKTDSVVVHDDGSYTVKLGFGRNIVKLLAENGAASYQVITAKPLRYTISNLSNPGEDFLPGDEVSVMFNTLYHPSNKMSGIYNMSAGIQYSNAETNIALILGPGQYTFASRAQEYKITIPADFTGQDFVLEKGVVKTKGFGSSYGAHRKITKQNGLSSDLDAAVREAYFGAIPDIHIPVANYTVTATSGTSDDWGVYQFGEISPAGASVVAKGGSIQYSFTPDPGYHIGSVTLGAYTDVTAQVVDNTFTIENVSSDTSITVLYAVDKNNSIAADDIVYWVGEGDNKVILAVNWADLSLAWGYRFATATLTVEEALDAVQAADSRFAYEAAYGYLSDIRFTDADQDLAIAPDFVMYNVNEEPIFLSYQEQLLSHGDILEFGVYSSVLTDNFWNNVWTARIHPVSIPASGMNSLSADKILVYPNPFVHYIIIDADANGRAEICDLSGRVLLTATLTRGKNQIATADLPQGVYLLKVGASSMKIIK